MSTMRPIRAIPTALLAAGLALLTAAAMAQPALPAAASTSAPSSPQRWLSVPLGTHTFGHLRTPDAIVATAGPKQVGFYSPPKGQDGLSFSPWSFDVAQDGSIWLLDQENQRLLMWQSGRPSGPVRTVKVPDPRIIADFAVADDGTIYASYPDINQRVPGMDYNMSLAALSPSGQVRWRGPTIMAVFNGQLRFGPDGALYWPGLDGTWTQLTTPAGRLLTIAEQRQRTSLGQPLSGGRRLVTTEVSDHEVRVVLLDPVGRAVRGWRVTSPDQLGGAGVTPALVGGDPVIVLGISRQTTAKFLYEYLVLRLAPNGGTRLRFSVDTASHVVWGDAPITGLRVGPDGQLYQLRANPAWGVRIARFSLQPPKPTPPTTSTPAGGVVPPSTVTPPPATKAPAPAVMAPTTAPVRPQPTAPSVQPQPTAPVRSVWRSLQPWLAAPGAVALTAAAEVWWWRRRHRHVAGPGRPRPAH
ncbi:MAG TPA: hypothetical protein VFA45_00915 [Actinomycetes bacterium]|nr:hypothetical protein [Actinomycetes bacterium]